MHLQNSKSKYWAVVDLQCGAYYNANQMLRLIFENALLTLYVINIRYGSFEEQLKVVEEGFYEERIRDKKILR